MKICQRFLSIILLATMLFGCGKWLEEERQANFQKCERACNSVFESRPQSYTMCMNAGLQSDGYYSGLSCQAYIQPHQYCLGAGYIPPEEGERHNNVYADCVTSYLQQQAQRQFESEQSARERQRTKTSDCYFSDGHYRCVETQN